MFLFSWLFLSFAVSEKTNWKSKRKIHQGTHYLYLDSDNNSDFFDLTDNETLLFYEHEDTNEVEFKSLDEVSSGLEKNNGDALTKSDSTNKNSNINLQQDNTSKINNQTEHTQYKCSFLDQDCFDIPDMKNIYQLTKINDSDTANTEELHKLTRKKNIDEASSIIEERVKGFLNSLKPCENHKGKNINIELNTAHEFPCFHQIQLLNNLYRVKDTIGKNKASNFDCVLFDKCLETKKSITDIFKRELVILKDDYKQKIENFKKNIRELYSVEYNGFQVSMEMELKKYENVCDTLQNNSIKDAYTKNFMLKDVELNDFCDMYKNICSEGIQEMLVFFMNETNTTDFFDNFIDDLSNKILDSLLQNISGNSVYILDGIKLFDVDDFFCILKKNRENVRSNLVILHENMKNNLLKCVKKLELSTTDQFLLIQQLSEIHQNTNKSLDCILIKEFNCAVKKMKKLVAETNCEIYSYFKSFFEDMYNQLNKIYKELQRRLADETEKIVEENFNALISDVLDLSSNMSISEKS